MTARDDVVHPSWCVVSACTASAGGSHYGKVQLVPEQPPERPGRMLMVFLAQPVDGPAEVHLSEDNVHVIRLGLGGARVLAYAVRDLAHRARRAER